MLENVAQCELQRYKNNYKALNLITTGIGKNVCDRVSVLMMFGLRFAILMKALLKLSHLIRTLIIGNMKPFLRKLGSL
jgi:hypothetical protein